MGHIPPIVDSYGGVPQWKESHIIRYKNLVHQYKTTIVAQWYGHVHRIEFRVDNDTALFTVGSISPIFRNDPTFTVWKYNTTSHELVDWITYGTPVEPVSATAYLPTSSFYVDRR